MALCQQIRVLLNNKQTKLVSNKKLIEIFFF